MGGESLTAAVRSGDVKAVTALLDAGGDPDAVDDRGTPALCLAVDGFDLATVEVLMFAPPGWTGSWTARPRCCGRSTAAPPTS